jgi:aryl carrier-like protein
MTSSIVATVGTATQAAYSAANAFQDEFARFRLSQNLAATSLSLGLILEVGSVSKAAAFQRLHQHNASYGISETEFLQLLEGALCQSSLASAKASSFAQLDPACPAQVVVGLEPGRFMPYVDQDRMSDLVWLNNTRFQAIRQAISDRTRDRRLAESGDGSPAGGGAASSLAAKLGAASTVEERTVVAREAIKERMALLLSIDAEDIDSGEPMAQYGFDSLVAAELRNWLIKSFGVEVTLLQLLSKSTKIEDLVKAAAAGR